MFKQNLNTNIAYMQLIGADFDIEVQATLANDIVMKEIGRLSIEGYAEFSLTEAELIDFAYMNIQKDALDTAYKIKDYNEQLEEGILDAVGEQQIPILKERLKVITALISNKKIYNNIVSNILPEIQASDSELTLEESFSEEATQDMDIDELVKKTNEFSIAKEIMENEKVSQRANLHTNLRIFFATTPDSLIYKTEMVNGVEKKVLKRFDFIDAIFCLFPSIG